MQVQSPTAFEKMVEKLKLSRQDILTILGYKNWATWTRVRPHTKTKKEKQFVKTINTIIDRYEESNRNDQKSDI